MTNCTSEILQTSQWAVPSHPQHGRLGVTTAITKAVFLHHTVTLNPLFSIKGSLCSQMVCSAREEELSILQNTVLGPFLGHQVLPLRTGALMPTSEEYSFKRNTESVSDIRRGNLGWKSVAKVKPFMRYLKVFHSCFPMVKVRKNTTTKSSNGKMKHFQNCYHTSVYRDKAAQSLFLCSNQT